MDRTAIVATGTPWEGNLVPVYWFAGYAYEEGLIPLAVDPATGFAGTSNCENPPQAWAADSLGGMGLFQDGVFACPQGGSALQGGGFFGSEGGSEFLIGGEALPDSSAITFVELATTTTSAFMEALHSMKQTYGLHVLVGLAPDGLICRTSDWQRQALSADSRATLVTTETIPGIPPATAEDLQAGEPGFAKRAWNAMLIPPSPPDTTISETFPPCIDGDEDALPQPYPTWQTSIYMMGEVGVSLLFMESEDDRECNHSQQIYTENWTSGERNTAVAKVAQGLRDLADLAPDRCVTFSIVDPTLLETTVEPIQLNSYDDYIWKAEAMEQLGYTTGTAEDRLRAFVNDRRSEQATDWWIAGFLIRDVCDVDHRFLDGKISFASYYGPSMVLLYINGYEYTVEYLGYVAVHETCHLFGAPDEYDTGTPHNCWVPHGYLRERNGNAIGCADPQEPCIMNDNLLFCLCPFTRAHIGWRDSDDPPDEILDPIDHPSSDRSMIIGDEEPLDPGDWVDIYGSGDDWVKRLVASYWSMDQGHVLWDGIRYDGLVRDCGNYSWRRNGGSSHQGALAYDTAAPVISDLLISLQTQPALSYALSFRFEDPDTRSGRVRAVASPAFPGPPDIKIIPDDYLLDTQGADPITRVLPELGGGWWDMAVRVWDVGDGQWDSEEIPFYYGGSAVDDSQILVPELTLSRGRPTPSATWVEWELQRDQTAEVDLKVVGADGRCVKSWPARTAPAGVTKILWDGLDNGGTPVAAGRYYLVVSDGSGIVGTRAAILVR